MIEVTINNTVRCSELELDESNRWESFSVHNLVRCRVHTKCNSDMLTRWSTRPETICTAWFPFFWESIFSIKPINYSYMAIIQLWIESLSVVGFVQTTLCNSDVEAHRRNYRKRGRLHIAVNIKTFINWTLIRMLDRDLNRYTYVYAYVHMYLVSNRIATYRY